MNTQVDKARDSLNNNQIDLARTCHCGKDGHALNSVNCFVHGLADIDSKLEIVIKKYALDIEEASFGENFPKELIREIKGLFNVR